MLQLYKVVPFYTNLKNAYHGSDSEGELGLSLLLACGGSSSYIDGRSYVIGKRSPVS